MNKQLKTETRIDGERVVIGPGGRFGEIAQVGGAAVIHRRKPFKQWVIEEAAFQQRCVWTIYRWRAEGRFRHLRFEHRPGFTRQLLVSGTSVRLEEPVKHYDFSNVDWSQGNTAISRAIGCHYMTVKYRRGRIREALKEASTRRRALHARSISHLETETCAKKARRSF